MNNDIKEILDKLKSNNYPFVISSIDINKLLDYITNLQKENDRLKEILHWKQIENNIFYKSRIDKEVEILEEEKKIPEKLTIYDCIDAYSKFDINDNRKAINEILDYLKSKGE